MVWETHRTRCTIRVRYRAEKSDPEASLGTHGCGVRDKRVGFPGLVRGQSQTESPIRWVKASLVCAWPDCTGNSHLVGPPFRNDSFLIRTIPQAPSKRSPPTTPPFPPLPILAYRWIGDTRFRLQIAKWATIIQQSFLSDRSPAGPWAWPGPAVRRPFPTPISGSSLGRKSGSFR